MDPVTPGADGEAGVADYSTDDSMDFNVVPDAFMPFSWDNARTQLEVTGQQATRVRRRIVTGSESKRVRDFVKEVSTDVREKVKEKAEKIKEEAERTLDEVKRKAKQVTRKATGIRRKILTGSANKRVRDYMMEMPVVKRKDKVSFVLGVLVMNLAQWCLLVRPDSFGILFLIVMTPLLSLRYYIYKKAKWDYFLLDFCYFTQLLCFIGILTPSRIIRQLVFVYSNGPLAAAIAIWRCSLVFHSLDKVTSISVHMFPALLSYCWRWHWESDQDRSLICDNKECTLTFQVYGVAGFVGYMIWQVAYLIKTEIVDKEKIESDDNLYTSMKWQTKPGGTVTSRLYVSILRKVGIMSRDEELSYKSVKTKITFVSFQLVYTIITIIPTIFMFHSHTVHVIFLLLMHICGLYNGASFYIEVFAKSYLKQFQKSIDKMQRLDTDEIKSSDINESKGRDRKEEQN